MLGPAWADNKSKDRTFMLTRSETANLVKYCYHCLEKKLKFFILILENLLSCKNNLFLFSCLWSVFLYLGGRSYTASHMLTSIFKMLFLQDTLKHPVFPHNTQNDRRQSPVHFAVLHTLFFEVSLGFRSINTVMYDITPDFLLWSSRSLHFAVSFCSDFLPVFPVDMSPKGHRAMPSASSQNLDRS